MLYAWWIEAQTAMRSLLRRKGFTAVTVIPLAVGIGDTTTLFSVVYGALLKSLPYTEPDRLMRIGERGESAAPDAIWSISVANFLDLEAGTDAFENLAAYSFHGFNLSGRGIPERYRGLLVTHDFFGVLGMPPELGRDFLPEDDRPGAEPVVILGRALWRQAFGGDPSVIGETVTLDGIQHRIIGVANREFGFVADPQLWVPFAWSEEQRAGRRGRWIEAIGRLAPGATAQAGLAELRVLYAGLADAYPRVNGNRSVGGRTLRDWLVGRSAPRRLLLFGGAAVLVLLIACANVANLGLARAETRNQELAVRAALGAGPYRLARLLMSESVILALLGGALGTVLALVGVDLLLARVGQWIPRALQISVSGMALAFALSLSVLTGVLVGIVPTLRLKFENLQGHLGQGRSGLASLRTSARRVLVVTEIALALVLVAGAGLMIRSVWRLSRVDLGVDTKGLVTFVLALPDSKYPDPPAALAYYDAALSEIAAIPSVSAVGAQNRKLLYGGGNARITVQDEPHLGFEGLVETRETTPGLFTALGMRVIMGRSFTEQDRRNGGVVIVNRAFVRAVFGSSQPLGRSFAPSNSEGLFTIVGVVNDVRDFGPDEAAPPIAYYPYGAGPWGTWPYLVVAARVEGNPLRAVPTIRERLAVIDPEVPLAEIATMEDIATETLGAQRRTALFLFGLFAVVALALGAVGIYSVMAYTVEQRTREMGIRRALGASADSVIRLVLRQSLWLAGIGVGIGLLGALALGRALSSLLFDVSPFDPITLASVAAILVGVALAACYLPARRAASVSAMEALRHD